jgi:acetyl-CoA acetyltransferase
VSDNVYILGVGMIKFGKNIDQSVKQMTGESLKLALEDAGLSMDAIEAAWFSNSGWGSAEFQHGIRGQVALTPHGLDNVSIINVENACASGSTALHSAWMSVKAGVYGCALAIGTEKMYVQPDPRWAAKIDGFISGTDVEETLGMMEAVKAEAKKRREQKEKEAKEQGKEMQPDKGHSIFMEFYGAGARAHMKRYGTTQRQLAVIAAKAHNNSTMNPLAQYTFPQTVEQVMEDREISYPLTRAMCAPIGDGSAAAIVVSDSFLKKHPSDRAIRILASIMQSGSRTGGDAVARAAKMAYEKAGVGVEDVNLMEVHDATAFGELAVTERLGLCEVGGGGPLAESGATSLGGRIPVNPSGGLMSRGHPIGASGLAQTYELITQLRGEAGQRMAAARSAAARPAWPCISTASSSRPEQTTAEGRACMAPERRLAANTFWGRANSSGHQLDPCHFPRP